MREQGSEGGPATRAARLDGALGNAQHLGRLGDREPLHVDEDECQTLGLGERCQRGPDIDGRLGLAVAVMPVRGVDLRESGHGAKCSQVFSRVNRSANEMPMAESTKVKWMTATIVTI